MADKVLTLEGLTHFKTKMDSEIDTKLNSKLDASLKGTANGLAELDSTGKVPSSQIPAVDLSEYYTSTEVDSAIAAKVAEIVAGAPEDFDTLKEMSDWISSHESDASAMNSAIQTNTNDISELSTNKVDKVAGKSLVSDTEIARLATLSNPESITTGEIDSLFAS